MAGLRCLGGEIGRRTGLKIPRSNIRAGSTPARGTNKFKGLGENQALFYCALVSMERPSKN